MVKSQPIRNLNCHILCINYEFKFFQFLSFHTASTLGMYSFILWEKIASVLPFSAIYNKFFISYFQLKSLFFLEVYYIYTHRPLTPI